MTEYYGFCSSPGNLAMKPVFPGVSMCLLYLSMPATAGICVCVFFHSNHVSYKDSTILKTRKFKCNMNLMKKKAGVLFARLSFWKVAW